MKSSDRDHIKAKFKPTFFGLFEPQYDSLLKNVYAYIYNKTVWNPPGITGCGYIVSGGYEYISLDKVKREFDMYSPEVQGKVLARVKQYLVDFDSSTIFPPPPEARERLVEVLDYFQNHITDSIRATSSNLF